MTIRNDGRTALDFERRGRKAVPTPGRSRETVRPRKRTRIGTPGRRLSTPAPSSGSERGLPWRVEEREVDDAREGAATARFHRPLDLQADWDVAVRTQHNLLLEGSTSDTEERLAALKPHLREPLCEFRPTEGACVPQPREGTLILVEVTRLDAAQQTTLLRWFDQHVPVRIVGLGAAAEDVAFYRRLLGPGASVVAAPAPGQVRTHDRTP